MFTYIDDGSVEHLLDIYHPAENGNNHLIFDIHGGSMPFWFLRALITFLTLTLSRKAFRCGNQLYPRQKKETSIYNQILDIFRRLHFWRRTKKKLHCHYDNFHSSRRFGRRPFGPSCRSRFQVSGAQEYYKIKPSRTSRLNVWL